MNEKKIYKKVSNDTKLFNIAFDQWVMSLVNDDKIGNGSDVYQFLCYYLCCCKLCEISMQDVMLMSFEESDATSSSRNFATNI